MSTGAWVLGRVRQLREEIDRQRARGAQASANLQHLLPDTEMGVEQSVAIAADRRIAELEAAIRDLAWTVDGPCWRWPGGWQIQTVHRVDAMTSRVRWHSPGPRLAGGWPAWRTRDDACAAAEALEEDVRGGQCSVVWVPCSLGRARVPLDADTWARLEEHAETTEAVAGSAGA